MAWASSCISVAVHDRDSQLHGVSGEELSGALDRALAVWASVDCDGAPPSLALENAGFVECGRPEYNTTGGNANVLMIREGDWPYPAGADGVGRTALVWDRGSGELYDADIELNGFSSSLTLDPSQSPNVDAILLHEVGHFLGLDHSDLQESVMWFGYDPDRAVPKALSADDVDGVCAVYPPDRRPRTTDCAPRHGFASQCGGQRSLPAPPPLGSGGCSLGRPRRPGPWVPFVPLVPLVICRRKRRRRDRVAR